ncbi:MAG: DUF2232 domain-containing protein [Ruminococcaceae bacterium]|nr:DUF2232 domain-containing protein [Oscillospiraceae bacterium]
MNGDQKQNKDKNLITTALLSLYVVFAACFIPIVMFVNVGDLVLSAISLAACALSIAALSFAAGSFKSIFGYAITVIALIFLGATAVPLGLFSSFAAGACVYAYLLLKQRTPFLYGIPAIAPIIVTLVTGQLTYIILSLLWLPCSLLLFYTVKKRLARVSAICHVSAGICLGIVVLLGIFVFSIYGSVSMSALRTFVDEIKHQTVVMMNLVIDEMASAMGELPIDLKSYVEMAVQTVFNLLPAIIIIIGNVFAYVMHSMILSVCFSSDEDRKEVLPLLSFEMSLVSAIVFIISLVLAFLLVAGDMAFYGAIAENVMLILCPGLILTTLGALRMLTTRKGPSCLGSLLYFGVIFMICSFSIPVIIICSIAGAILIILSNIAKLRSDKKV